MVLPVLTLVVVRPRHTSVVNTYIHTPCATELSDDRYLLPESANFIEMKPLESVGSLDSKQQDLLYRELGTHLILSYETATPCSGARQCLLGPRAA